MAISFNRYINITSSVGAPTQAVGRNLGGRVFTSNNLLPPGSNLPFSSATPVGAYFGKLSEEYLRALFYFSFISKNNTAPSLISFARWVETAVAPMIYGNPAVTQTLATYTAISTGSFGLTIGGIAHPFGSLDFSAAASLSDVAAVLQTAIRTASGTQWTAATVTFNSLTGAFDFVGGSAVAATITVQEGTTGVHIAGLLGWLTGAILANGSAVESITTTLTNSYSQSNNFGSFLFIPDLDLAQITEASAWVDTLDVELLYFAPAQISDAATYFAALENYGGVGITVAPITTQYPEQLPAMIFAATDYTAVNSVQNFMFQQTAGLTPSVTDDTTANTMDTNQFNYYGQTQQAGQPISFFQTGVLMGLATDPGYMNLFANEIWLKDAIGVALMNLLLALPQVPANTLGQSQILSVLQSVVNQAVLNGTISVGKRLTQAQILYITENSGNANAWQQVQNIGYWLNCQIVPNGLGGFKAIYTLIYGKDDVIRMVDGSDILI